MSVETTQDAKEKFEQAAAEVQDQIDGKTKPEETSSESVVEEKSSDETPEDAQPSDELSEDEIVQARNLFRALKDPKTSNSVVAALAQQAGLLQQPATTKKEEISQKKEVIDFLREGLGKEYEFLADRLGPAIEKIVHQERLENESRLEQVRRAGIESEVASAFDRLARETKGESKKLEPLMTQLSEKIPAGSMAPLEYLRVLYVQAQHERGVRSEQERNRRINKNASDASSRLSATASGSRSEVPSKKMNINQAVEFAVGEVLAGRGTKR